VEKVDVIWQSLIYVRILLVITDKSTLRVEKIFNMVNDWIYIGLFLLISLFLPAAAIMIAGLVSPKKPNKIKNSAYECGIETVGDAWVQFKVQYYIYAIIFLVFDVETVFLYPWAVAYRQLTLFAVFEAVIFLVILAGGLFYAWKKGALQWV
jgi:NADH-quinone oxidoreductase subunit A